jgi:hypothetical protein
MNLNLSKSDQASLDWVMYVTGSRLEQIYAEAMRGLDRFYLAGKSR